MKLQKIANIALKEMVKSYSESGKEAFYIDYFKNLFPSESEDHISNGLCLLKEDSLVTIQFGDGIARMTFLSVSGIRSCQENTLLKKGYSCLKEVRALIG